MQLRRVILSRVRCAEPDLQVFAERALPPPPLCPRAGPPALSACSLQPVAASARTAATAERHRPTRVPTAAPQKTRVQIWLFENTDMRIEGRIIVSALSPSMLGCLPRRWLTAERLAWQGFDEYMNLVLDDAEELSIKKKTRKALGEPPALSPRVARIVRRSASVATPTRRAAVRREDSAQGRQHHAHDERDAASRMSPHRMRTVTVSGFFACDFFVFLRARGGRAASV